MFKLSLLRVGATCLLFSLVTILIQKKIDLPVYASNESTVLIEKVYPDGLALNDVDEAVQLINLSDQAVNIGGWGLSDDAENLNRLTFPDGSILGAGERIWVTRNGLAFKIHFGALPDYEQTDSLPEVENMLGIWPGFSNAGDEVILADGSGQIVDALAYEGSSPTELVMGDMWIGESLEFEDVGAAYGQIFFRKLNPITGLPIPDTNSAADWGQDPSDPITGRRPQYPGWEVERFLEPYQTVENANLTVAIGPDNAYETISTLFDGAKSSILIETHTFESLDILAHLKAAAERGVEVKLLLEGGPPGGIDDSQRWNCYQLYLAGGQCFLMQNDSDEQIFDRYTFIHAKFMIIDGAIAAVGSDNLSPNSMPADVKTDGTFGRRGVTLITDSAGVVSHLQKVFNDDLDQTNHHDILAWQPSQTSIPAPYENGITYTVAFPKAATFTGDFEFELVQVPENFLNPDKGLFGLLARAGSGDTVLVQQQYERRYWGPTEEGNPNLRLDAYVAAARRGSKVELLLDSHFDNPSSLTSNSMTCEKLNDIALAERLDLKCQLGNPTGLGIHNKMVLAEIGGRGYIHVGSINGSEQSAKINREMALQVQSDEAYALLRSMFMEDFVRTVHIPLIFNEYEPPTDRLLISEVFYDSHGADDAAEFIEIVNPSNKAVDISGYSLSDAVTPEDPADLRRFPAGTIIPAGGVFVVAQQAQAFTEQFFVVPNFELFDTDPNVPDLIDDINWGFKSVLLRLKNSGDVVLFRDPFDNVLDVLVYGDKIVPGYPSCPLVEFNGSSSLRRNPFNYDTDGCSDFEEWLNPTPGVAP